MRKFFCILNVTEEKSRIRDPLPVLRGTDPRIRIRTKMSRIPNTGKKKEYTQIHNKSSTVIHNLFWTRFLLVHLHWNFICFQPGQAKVLPGPTPPFVAIACYARCAGQHSPTLLVAIACYARCAEMDVTEIIFVKIYWFCQLSSHSCGFFARVA
jgi:hypothetical protein